MVIAYERCRTQGHFLPGDLVKDNYRGAFGGMALLFGDTLGLVLGHPEESTTDNVKKEYQYLVLFGFGDEIVTYHGAFLELAVRIKE